MPVWCTLAVVHWGINLHADGQCAGSPSPFRRQLKLLKTGEKQKEGLQPSPVSLNIKVQLNFMAKVFILFSEHMYTTYVFSFPDHVKL